MSVLIRGISPLLYIMTAVHRTPSPRLILACAILYALLTLAFLGDRPITRTQEARVLETSRQMLDAPDWHGWLVPQLNGEARLRKPPLCYWYTAAAFKVFGVNEGAGRIPPLLIGWASIVVTYLFGRDLLGRRGGFIAAAALASSHFFIRFIRSDETDIPAMFGVVLACWGITRASMLLVPLPVLGERVRERGGSGEGSETAGCLGLLAPHPALPPSSGRGCGSVLWFPLAAVGIAVAAMSKGPPAIFPLVFLALLCWAMRSRTPALRFLCSGAPVTALVLIVPWFAYALSDPAARQVADELVVVTSGSNHRGLFVNYIPVILQMLLPWTPVLIAAFFARPLRRAPIDLPGRVAVCAVLGVFLPLCVTLNVQAHYLLPTLPGFALVIAWTLTRALESEDKTARALAIAWRAAIWILVLVGSALVVVQLMRRSSLDFNDVAAAVALVVAGGLLWLLGRRADASRRVTIFAALMIIVMPIVGGWWAPGFNRDHSREAAAAIRERFGGRPLIGWGSAADISLSFNLRQAIPWLTDAAALRARLNEGRAAVVVTQRDERGGTPLPDVGVTKTLDLKVDKDELLFFERPSPTTAP